ncbi:MAG: hypothetical protein JJT99_09580 [Rhodobacteraceae bacterium]|nr:hypothetical protein [Paracoccaceae bacterium]
MNEALSRREIEDVLSSIRKLVSHAPERPGGAALGRGNAGAPADRASGTLVLTSALRVADAPDAATPISPPPAKGQDTAAAPAPPEASEPERAVSSSPAPRTEAEDIAASSGARTRAALDTLRSSMHLASEEAPESSQNTAPPETPDSPVAGGASIDDALEATLARLEQALSSSPKPGQGGAPATDAGQQAAGAGARASGDKPGMDGGDDPVIDEAMLYQIVAHIVRQELQGELGEKITRNIRKLVRAEVARELHLRNQ